MRFIDGRGKYTLLAMCRRLLFAGLLGFLLMAPIRAQQTGAASPAKPLVPAAVTTLLARPEVFIGEQVTLTAAVERVLSPTAFLIDQDKAASSGKDLLVVTPNLYGAVDINTYVTVIGEVVRWDPEAVAAKLKEKKIAAMVPELAAKYRGQPVVLATSVISPAFVDLTKRLPPPMTAEEEPFSRIMRRIGPAFAALRKAIEASNNELAAKNTSALKQAFVEVEEFWKKKATADATMWAQEARLHVESIERAAAMANWGTVKASATALNDTCQACHNAYRERFDDDSYRFKIKVK
jgi:cytochrome c556